MNYWLTTHWPPNKNEPADFVLMEVCLAEGREKAGADFAEGDLIFIYQSQSGKTRVETLANGTKQKIRRQAGRGGIVAIAKAVTAIAAEDVRREHYTDGKVVWWRWRAPLELISKSGFVPAQAVAVTLGYKRTYGFRGFGKLNSGLKKLTEDQFEALRKRFHDSVPIEPLDSELPKHGPGGESQAHLDLKNYVAANPSLVLGEPKVETVAVERPFSTGDRADIVLRDQNGSIIGLEIELAIRPRDITGPLQAIKYRRMLEMVSGAKHDDGRAILVAYAIPDDVRELCDRYEVECFVVNPADVGNWLAKD